MFSFVVNAVKKFYYGDDSSANFLEDDFLKDGDEAKENDDPKAKNGDERNSAEELRYGTVTYLTNEYGLIDKMLFFELNVIPKTVKLNVGDVVSYTTHRVNDQQAERIVNIKVLQGGLLDSRDGCEGFEPVAPEEGPPVWLKGNKENETDVPERMERIINGKVTMKKGREIRIEPIRIWCNLDKIKSEFSPFEGDWLSVMVDVAVDVNVINLAGNILSVKHIKPLMVREGRGTITFVWNKNNETCNGVIENEIRYFVKNCNMDCTPSLGDVVQYEAVESDQGKWKWRATWIKSLTSSASRRKIDCTKTLLSDKNGIVIAGSRDFDTIELGSEKEVEVIVRNNGNVRQKLLGAQSNSLSSSQMNLVTDVPSRGISIEPGEEITLNVSCRGKFLGVHSELVTFNFENFSVGRMFNVSVTVSRDSNRLFPCDIRTQHSEVPSFRYTSDAFDHSDALYGSRPIVHSHFRRGLKIGNYKIPETLFTVIPENSADRGRSMEYKRSVLKVLPCLEGGLSPENYVDRFHTALYLEEIAEMIYFKQYDMTGVILKRRGQYFALDVSTVGDRKSITIGTAVVVTQPWSEVNTSEQIGYVHEIRDAEIHIKFHASFHSSYDESDCNVSFEPKRTTWIRCHFAVDLAVERLGFPWLFPASETDASPRLSLQLDPSNGDDAVACVIRDDSSMSDLECDVDEDGYAVPRLSKRSPRRAIELFQVESEGDGPGDAGEKPKIKLFDKNLNERQQLCVASILEGRGRPLPYIINGPPGTGKTITVVEAVLQIYNNISDSRIIISTPSNSASDIICEYLIASGQFTPGELVRVLSRNRAMENSTPEGILPFCTTVQNDIGVIVTSSIQQGIRLSTTEAVGRQRIVICTLGTAFSLHYHGLQQGHFSHIFIDEACQATEPEALISLSFLDLKKGQAILCGDPQQLGPVCLSRLSEFSGLRTSLMERLTTLRPYAVDRSRFPKTNGFNPRFITQLNVNYRSIPEILSLPSQMFYNSDLIPTVSQTNGTEAEIVKKFSLKSDREGRPTAVLFHGIRGQNLREDGTMSWYNPLEIWQVICYLKKLYSIDLEPDDVGIITPYHKQVEKLRLLMTALDVPQPKIGSVEEFQGQERNVIILSTVRSSIHRSTDRQRALGFVSFPRRLNVAVTRARALLIIIGNPYTLSLDPYWLNVIQYCWDIGGYLGCPLLDLLELRDGSEEEKTSERG